MEIEGYRFAVTLPAGCRHVEGPGTVDAVCSPDLDPERSAVAGAISALVLSAAADPLADGDNPAVTCLRRRHTEAAFKAELPEAVCGETDRARVQIRNFRQTVADGRVVYDAQVVCAAIRFLRIDTRHAVVRHVIASDTIYRLMARAPQATFKKHRGIIDAFMASFRVLPPGPVQMPASKQVGSRQ